MGIELESVNGISDRWSVAAKPCDTCKSAAAAVFCRADSAFLCLHCDLRIHGVNKLASRQAHVWMCQVCEQSPAVVTCKADAAVLCVTCDADIHSANPLASRHERVPVEPFFDAAVSVVESSPFNLLLPATGNGGTDYGGECRQHEDIEAGTWLLPNLNLDSKLSLENTPVNVDMKPVDLIFPDTHQFIDFDYPNSFHQHHNAGTDSVVPVQAKPAPFPMINNENCYDIDFRRSKLSSFSYPSQSLSQSVSSSSPDVGVVPVDAKK